MGDLIDKKPKLSTFYDHIAVKLVCISKLLEMYRKMNATTDTHINNRNT